MRREKDEARLRAAVAFASARNSGESFGMPATTSSESIGVATAAQLPLVPMFLLVLGLECFGHTFDRGGGPRGFFNVTIPILSLQAAATVFVSVTIAFAPSRWRDTIQRRMRSATTRRVAREQSLARGFTRDPNRAGLAIFTSPAEGYVPILAEIGLGGAVDDKFRQEANEELSKPIEKGRVAETFVRG